MSEFVYLFRISAAAQAQAMGTPEHAQRSMQVWLAWMRDLEAKGHIKNPGQPLETTGQVVRGNRAIAIGQRDGPERGMEALQAIAHRDRLSRYPFHAAALGEFELQRGDRTAAREHFQTALGLARNGTERRFFEKRLESCGAAARSRAPGSRIA